MEKLCAMDTASKEGIGVYIHVPFCASKCAYCDFYSRVRQDQKEAYILALCKDIRSWKERGLRTGTLFFGGGTPSLLTEKDFTRIFEALEESLPILSGAEVTLEANPETVTADFLSALRRIGFNRISFGVQSAVDKELHALGRRHTFDRAKKAFYDAGAAGFENISLDLMLGIPYQTAGSLEETLKKITELHPAHLSYYLLKIEEGTPFYFRHAEKNCVSDDETADFYLRVCRKLEESGYIHYEISNFSLPGYESRHNLKYWRDEPYLGFGPAAHSCLDGRRFFNLPDLDAYIRADRSCVRAEDDSPAQDAFERLMLGLRLREGVDLSQIACLDASFDAEKQRFFLKKAELFLKNGLMGFSDGRFFLTERGMLVSNILLAELLDW